MLPFDRPGIATNSDRVAIADRLEEEINQRLADRSAEEVLEELVTSGIPAGRIRSIPEVYGWEQVHHLGLVHRMQHPTLGEIAVPGPPLMMDGIPMATRQAPPVLGHDDEHWDQLWEEDGDQ